MPRRPSVSCRQFRRQHAEYTDGFLSGELTCAIRAHLDACPECAQRDVWVRRSLLALQTLPTIEPSDDFRERLMQRLALEPPERQVRHTRGVRWGIVSAVVAASLVLLALGGARSHGRAVEPERLAPVLALTRAHLATPVVASIPTRAAVTTPAASSMQEPGAERALSSVATLASSSPRFESLPGMGARRRPPAASTFATVRLQLASFPGQ